MEPEIEKRPNKTLAIIALVLLAPLTAYVAFYDRLDPYVSRFLKLPARNDHWWSAIWVVEGGTTPWLQLDPGPKKTIVGQLVLDNGNGYSLSLPLVQAEYLPPRVILFSTRTWVSNPKAKVQPAPVTTYYVLCKLDDEAALLYRLKSPPGDLHLSRSEENKSGQLFVLSDLKFHEKLCVLKKHHPAE